MGLGGKIYKWYRFGKLYQETYDPEGKVLKKQFTHNGYKTYGYPVKCVGETCVSYTNYERIQSICYYVNNNLTKRVSFRKNGNKLMVNYYKGGPTTYYYMDHQILYDVNGVVTNTPDSEHRADGLWEL